jgi:hypothetical protein
MRAEEAELCPDDRSNIEDDNDESKEQCPTKQHHERDAHQVDEGRRP